MVQSHLPLVLLNLASSGTKVVNLLVLNTNSDELVSNIEDIERLVDAWVDGLAQCNSPNGLLVPSLSEDGKGLMNLQRYRPGDDVVSQEWRLDDFDWAERAPAVGLDDRCPTTIDSGHDAVVDKTPLIFNRLGRGGRGINLVQLGIGELLLDQVEANVDEPIPRKGNADSALLGSGNLGAVGGTVGGGNGESGKGLGLGGIVGRHNAHLVQHAVHERRVGLADEDAHLGGADLLGGEVPLNVTIVDSSVDQVDEVPVKGNVDGSPLTLERIGLLEGEGLPEPRDDLRVAGYKLDLRDVGWGLADWSGLALLATVLEERVDGDDPTLLVLGVDNHGVGREHTTRELDVDALGDGVGRLAVDDGADPAL